MTTQGNPRPSRAPLPIRPPTSIPIRPFSVRPFPSDHPTLSSPSPALRQPVSPQSNSPDDPSHVRPSRPGPAHPTSQFHPRLRTPTHPTIQIPPNPPHPTIHACSFPPRPTTRHDPILAARLAESVPSAPISSDHPPRISPSRTTTRRHPPALPPYSFRHPNPARFLPSRPTRHACPRSFHSHPDQPTTRFPQPLFNAVPSFSTAQLQSTRPSRQTWSSALQSCPSPPDYPTER